MNSVNFGDVNWLAVTCAAVVTFLLGGVWYTAIFGKAWQKAHLVGSGALLGAWH